MKYRESARFSVGVRVRNKNPRSPQFGQAGLVEKVWAGKNPIPFLDVRYDGEVICAPRIRTASSLKSRHKVINQRD